MTYRNTLWGLRDKQTKRLLTEQELCLTPRSELPALFFNRSTARNLKNREDRVVKVNVTIKEAA